jgi:ankyrin repeat protein
MDEELELVPSNFMKNKNDVLWKDRVFDITAAKIPSYKEFYDLILAVDNDDYEEVCLQLGLYHKYMAGKAWDHNLVSWAMNNKKFLKYYSDCEDCHGSTLLNYLISQNSISDVEKVLKYADVNHIDTEENTALIYATSPEMISVLVNNGAWIDFRDEYGETALVANIRRMNFANAQKLLELSINVDIQSNDGNTALILLFNYMDISFLSILLAYNPNIDIQNNDGVTALMCSVGKCYKSFKILLRAGANVNLQDIDGCTALMISTRYDIDVKYMKKLLKYGANVNLQNNQGSTALMLSMLVLDTEKFNLLLKASTDVHLKDKKEETVFDMLDRYKHMDNAQDIVNYLKMHAIKRRDTYGAIDIAKDLISSMFFDFVVALMICIGWIIIYQICNKLL